MRIILQLIYILVLFHLITPNAYSTNYYVDKNVTGQNNGTSWANAWQSFSVINWSSINPGDVIFISGGTDSTIYFERLVIGASGTPGNYVTIRNSYESGHNGKVIIEDPNTNSFDGCLYMAAKDWVYIKGIETRKGIRAAYLYTLCDYVTIDSCIFRDWHPNGLTGGVKIEGNDNFPDALNCTNIEIKNCIVESLSLYNLNSTDAVYGQGVLKLRIHDNFIHQRNTSTNNMHVDCIQLYRTADVRIWNNVCIVDPGVQGHGMILGIESRANNQDTMICYNNYVYAGGHELGGDPDINAVFNRWYGYNYPPLSYWINNTLVTRNSNESPIVMEYMGFLKNNIIVQFGTNGQPPSWPLPTINSGNGVYFDPPCYVDSCTNNLIWREWGDVQFYGQFRGNGNSGTPSGWFGWVNTYGGTGVSSNPSFTNPLGSYNGFILNSNSPAINAGGNLQAFVESKGLPWADILGNLRDSSPNIGAYELESPVGVDDNLTVYPSDYALYQNYPNPFNPTTKIKYGIDKRSNVRLVIYNILGQHVQTLVNKTESAGIYQIDFQAHGLSSGVYLYSLIVDGNIDTKQMILLK
ncbi:MAG TPA: T9SS type A sorting domain-containing protein [Candidatus Dojkabacteria bacterium]|nr:T9SS type A sorting domain-containing protein [Candidatus Dojkabacteria bacterium]